MSLKPSHRQVLAALTASMRHWRRVWEGRDIKISGEHCSLCKIFKTENCYGCPVKGYGMGCNRKNSPCRTLDEAGPDSLCKQEPDTSPPLFGPGARTRKGAGEAGGLIPAGGWRPHPLPANLS
jgi:hypothetical protein